MRIHSARFVLGAAAASDAPGDALPEVAFAGRSNVGKSSLINRLVQRQKLARTSAAPGKTQQLNYYLINEQFYLVDLPGYGYVRGGVELRHALGRLTDGYLDGRRQLRAVVQLVDARHGPTDLDLTLVERLRGGARPFLLVFTKADKLSRAQLARQLTRLEGEGQLAELPYLPFSSVSGEGRDDLWRWIEEVALAPASPAADGRGPRDREERAAP